MILVNFNVVAQAAPTLSHRAPDRPGIQLFNMFYEQSVGRVAVVVDDDYPRDQFEQWLKMYNLRPAIHETLDTGDPVLKANKIHLLVGSLGRTEWYVDSDPGTIRECLQRGIPSLLVASPYVVRPEWQPGYAPKAWSELVAEIEEGQLKKAEKVWQA